MASSSAGVTAGGNKGRTKPGSYCGRSSRTKAAEREMVPCKQRLTVKGNADHFQTSPAIFFGEFYG